MKSIKSTASKLRPKRVTSAAGLHKNPRTKLVNPYSSKASKWLPDWAQVGAVVALTGSMILLSSGALTGISSSSNSDIINDDVGVDQLATINAASEIAATTQISVRNNVINMADTLNTQVNYISDYDSTVNKPITPVVDETVNREVRTYTAKAGDTVPELAEKFDISSATIRWANDIDGDAVNANQKLRMPPISGVFHKVESGDTPDSVAKEYKANAQDITSFNNAEVDGLEKGSEIFVPGGSIAAPAPAPVTQPAVTTVTNQQTTTTNTQQSSAPVATSTPVAGLAYHNNYAAGYCTWWAANRRAQIGRPVPASMGHAISWGAAARAAGYAVDSSPRVGDVAWQTYAGGYGGYGHVMFVEAVHADGSITVSEMNYAGGWNVASSRIVPTSTIGTEYQFIH